MGVRGVLVCCHCGHHIVLSADRWSDEMRLEALIPVTEGGGPTMFARIGIMRALNHGKPSSAVVRHGERKPGFFTVIR